jgi:hypothetical protein
VADHCLDPERGHDVDHVLTLGLHRGPAALPGVATVEEQHILVAALGPDRFHNRRNAVEAAHASIVLRQRREIFRRQRIGFRRAGGDPEIFAKLPVGQVRRQPFGFGHPEIDRGFAEIERHKLGMDIGYMQNRNRAQRIEAKDLRLRQALLRGSLSERAEPGRGRDGRSRCSRVQKISP